MGDTFTGGKRETNTQGGDYYEKVENLYQAPPTGVAARFQLPAAPPDFTGRRTELDELRAAASAGDVIFGLRGQGGVGKTTLALMLAHELKAQYPDAHIYLDLLGTTTPLTPGAVMAHTLRAFAPTAQLPDNDAGLAAAYRSVLHGQRALLFYDNAANAEQVLPLLPPPGCALIVTSRQRFTLPGLKSLNLERLPRPDAVMLLRTIAKRIGDHADALADLCGDLPQALRLAASLLAERDDLAPDEYAAKLQDEQGRLKALEPVMASLALSYSLLDAEAQTAWRALAVFVGDFDRLAAAAVLDADKDAAVDRLGHLLRYSLVEYDQATRRYRLHDLARDAAGSRLTGAERLGAEQRHAAHYGEVMTLAENSYLAGASQVLAGLALFDRERVNIEAGQAWASTHALESDAAARLCSYYAGHGNHIRHLRHLPRERIRWIESALAAARRLKDRRAEGVHLGNLGLAYTDLGEIRTAIGYHEQDLHIEREVGNRRAEGNALGSLGNAYAALGDTRRAIEFYQQHLVIAREIGDRRGEGADLGNLGLAYHALGEFSQAIAFYAAALVVRRAIGDRHGEGIDLGNMGNAYAALNEFGHAIEFYEQALVVRRAIGDRHGEGNVLGNLGIAYSRLGELSRAIEYYEQALIINRDIGDVRSEAAHLWHLSQTQYKMGQLSEAIANAEAALRLHQQFKDTAADRIRRRLTKWQAEQP